MPALSFTMRVTKASVRRVCAVCERTLLQGEVALRFSPDGSTLATFGAACPGLWVIYLWPAPRVE